MSENQHVLALIDDDPKILELTAKYLRDQKLTIYTGKNGKELDCNGMYLLPGFIDMHGHIGGKSQGAEPDYVFKLWMAHGITTVREPGGRGVDYTLDLKNKSKKNYYRKKTN